MSYSFILDKMKTEPTDPVSYFLSSIDSQTLFLNSLLGKNIVVSFLSEISCLSCGKQIKKTFFQGFCYPCAMSSALNSPCILRPELCEAHLGKGRDIEWERTYHLVPHYVYLSNTSDIKVGVTRASQAKTRWMDQGASDVIVLCETSNRHEAGLIEVFLKDYLSDKTKWQAMLKGEKKEVDLVSLKLTLFETLKETPFFSFLSLDHTVYSFAYPVLSYPKTVKSLSLDKAPLISSVLMGIKGQYLIFEEGLVLNIRRFSGYHVSFSC